MSKRLTSILATSALVPAALSATCLAQSNAFDPFELEIGGQQFQARKASYKCGIGDSETVSTSRLVSCDSAELIEFEYQSVLQRLMKFKIDPADRQISAGVRAELRDLRESKNGDETWYRFATLLPEAFPLEEKHRLVLAQWHERIRGDDKLDMRPPLSHRLWNGRFVVTLWNNHRLQTRGPRGDGDILFEIPRIERGLFHEFVYKINWSAGVDGRIVAWMRQCPSLSANCDDGSPWRQVIRYEGSTGYDNGVIEGYYFKLGLYTVSEFDVPFTAYHRDYRSGQTAESVGAKAAVFKSAF